MDNKDLSVNCWSSKKKGGRSTVEDKGVRIIHLPTGITVECDSERSQHQNRAIAITQLEKKVKQFEAYNG